MLDQDGKPVTTQGAPTLGVSWDPDSGLSGVVLKDGRAPSGVDEVAIDKATADRVGYEVGDTIRVVLTDGQQNFTIVGLVGLGNSDGFVGATTVVWDPASAATWLDTENTVDTIDIKLTDGADIGTVQAAIADVLPDRTEVITGEQLGDETKDQVGEIVSIFGTGLLIFALITALVAAFVINNIYNISISQRLRELALMRAVGASGGQVRKLVLVESLVVSAIATLLGMLGGLAVAKGLIAAFNTAGGGGFPEAPLLFKPRTAIVAAIVGIGVSVISVLVPAIRASHIPPVAAMRPEIGFSALSLSQRLIRGFVLAGVGAVLFLFGLFVRPGSGGQWGLLTGAGALLIVFGVTTLSAAIARPMSRSIGAPIAKMLGIAGRFARDNAATDTTPHRSHGVCADDRRDADHRRRDLHVVVARHVRTDPRTGNVVRLHRARHRVVPAAHRGDRQPARRTAGAVGGLAVPQHQGQRRRLDGDVHRRRPGITPTARKPRRDRRGLRRRHRHRRGHGVPGRR